MLLTSKCGCQFPSDSEPMRCAEHRPRDLVQGRWRCIACRRTVRGTVLLDEVANVKCDCGVLMVPTNGDDGIGEDDVAINLV